MSAIRRINGGVQEQKFQKIKKEEVKEATDGNGSHFPSYWNNFMLPKQSSVEDKTPGKEVETYEPKQKYGQLTGYFKVLLKLGYTMSKS